MSTFLTKVLGDKKEWRSMEARADALPRDHRIVYCEIKQYMWRFTSADGMDVVAVLKGVLDLFESGAAQGRHAFDVTGEDVAAFCDERLLDIATFTDRWRATLNRDLARKLGHDRRTG